MIVVAFISAAPRSALPISLVATATHSHSFCHFHCFNLFHFSHHIFDDAKVWQTSKPHNRLVMSFCIPHVGRPYTILVVYGIGGWEKSKLSQKQKKR